jgi:NAD+ diphosphatase
VDGSDEIIMDEKELKIAKWVTREEIELQSNDFSLTNEMMTLFKNNEIPSD